MEAGSGHKTCSAAATLPEHSSCPDKVFLGYLPGEATDSLAGSIRSCHDRSVSLTSASAAARVPNGIETGFEEDAAGRREVDRGAPGLDSISNANIEQLQSDGRRAYARFASAVGLYEAAVRLRVA